MNGENIIAGELAATECTDTDLSNGWDKKRKR